MYKCIKLYKNKEISEMELISLLRDFFGEELDRLNQVYVRLSNLGFSKEEPVEYKLYSILFSILNEPNPSINKIDHLIDQIENHHRSTPKELIFTFCSN